MRMDTPPAERPTRVRWLIFGLACAVSWLLYLHRYAWGVIRPAIKDAAKSILLVHNHPSGDPTPSEEDVVVTRRLEEAGATLGVPVLDHIVVARGGEVSIREFLDARA